MNLVIKKYCTITGNCIRVNGRIRFEDQNFITFAEFIKSVYKRENISYPKFYKMDPLSKLGFIAAELLMIDRNIDLYNRERMGVALANSASSLETDRVHQASIRDRNAYFPSPSVFVYTLPNIVIGEICIRHGIKGENAFLISERFESSIILEYVSELFASGRVDACLAGWLELLGGRYHSLMMFVEAGGKYREEDLMLPFDKQTLEGIFTNN